MANSKFEIALALVREGFSVIPGARAGKRPLIKWQEFQTRTPTEAELQAWWANWPTADILLVTGAISGIVVVDVDEQKCLGTLERLRPLIGSSPYETETGGGGRHVVFRHPGGEVKNRVRVRLASGEELCADVKGDRGYVVFPGSEHTSGKPYRAVGTEPELTRAVLASLPSFNPTWFPRGNLKVLDDGKPIEALQSTETIQRAGHYLDAMEPSIEGQGGDCRLFKAAIAMRKGFDLPVEVAEALIEQRFNPRCQPPWPIDRIRYKVSEAEKDTAHQWGWLVSKPRQPPALALPDLELPQLDLGWLDAVLWLRGYVPEVAKEAQCSFACALLGVLASLSIAVGREVKVDLKRSSPCAVNLYLLAVALSGGGKSLAFKLTTRWAVAPGGLLEWEASNLKPRDNLRKARLSNACAELAELQRAKADPEKIAAALAHVDSLRRPLLFPVVFGDVTPAKLTKTICDGNPHPIIVDPEGVALERACGAGQGGRADFGIYKSAWSREPVQRARVKDDECGSVYDPCLTLLMSVQPEKLRLLGAKAGEGAIRGEGLIARMLTVIEPDNLSERRPPPFEKTASDKVAGEAEYDAHLGALSIEAKRRFSEAGLTVLQLSRGAHDVYCKIYVDGNKSAQESPTMRDWLVRLHEHAGRLAALIHLAQEGPRGFETEISETQMELAAQLAKKLFLPHAEAACGVLGESPGDAEAKALAEGLRTWVLTLEPKEVFTVRDAMRRGPPMARKVGWERVAQAMTFIEDEGVATAEGRRYRKGVTVPAAWRVPG